MPFPFFKSLQSFAGLALFVLHISLKSRFNVTLLTLSPKSTFFLS
uniref:Uncharacterized protein n=1 Tax=Setaria italica TaxID=4555 RepID=K3YFA9_SETIT